MIKEFVSGKWYRYIGPGKGKDNIVWNNEGEMDFLLDGKPHKCNEGNRYVASFFDSPDPDCLWSFTGKLNYFEEVEMNDETIRIEKLEKELARLKEIVEAKKEKKIVAADFKGRAQDFDFHPYNGINDFLNVHLKIREMGIGGFGSYPFWNRRGFHIDNRIDVLCWFGLKNSAGNQVYSYDPSYELLEKLSSQLR